MYQQYYERIEEAREKKRLSVMAADAAAGLSFYIHGRRDSKTASLLKSGIKFCALMEKGRQRSGEERVLPSEFQSYLAYSSLRESIPENFVEFVQQLTSDGKSVLEKLLGIIAEGRSESGVDILKLRKIQKMFLDTSAPYLADASTILSSGLTLKPTD